MDAANLIMVIIKRIYEFSAAADWNWSSNDGMIVGSS